MKWNHRRSKSIENIICSQIGRQNYKEVNYSQVDLR